MTEKKSNIQGFDDRLRLFDEFRIAKSKILSPEDFTEVTIRDKKTKEIKKKKIILKSGWRKIKLFFGLSSEIIEVKRERDENKIIYMCKARVYTQSGISSEAVGICSSDEPGKSSMNEYVLSSIAQTRAINKAIADLVGVDFIEEEDIIDEETRDSEISLVETIEKERAKVKEEDVGTAETKIIPRDRENLLSQVFELLKELSSRIPRYEIFSRIKKQLKMDEKTHFRISELDTEQLREVIAVLNSIRKEIEERDKRSTSEKEEPIF